MALFSLLKIGIESAVENEKDSFLSSLTSSGVDESDAILALSAVSEFPNALRALTDAEWQVSSPPLAMVFLPVVTSYLLTEEDVIPTWDGSVLIGALDDAYITFSAALQAAEIAKLEGFDEFEAPRAALAKVIPQDTRQRLDDALSDAMQRASDRLS